DLGAPAGQPSLSQPREQSVAGGAVPRLVVERGLDESGDHREASVETAPDIPPPHGMARRQRPVLELVEQSRLAGSGGCVDQPSGARTLRLGQGSEESGDLLLAADRR